MIFESSIASLATAVGVGGIAIVRISGKNAQKLLSLVFKPAIHRFSDFSNWESHHLYYGKFVTPNGEWIDEGLAVWMKAPRSFTGEDIVECHLHGGFLISEKLLETLYSLGAEPAQPGEFSKRAFLNGKIDLTQAEALADMISSESELSLKLAQAQWRGRLSHPVSALRKTLLEILVELEAAIDFPEEEIDLASQELILKQIRSSITTIKDWLRSYETGRLLREGLTIALIGKPNVGKSSLLNRWVGEEASIVHEKPGTTRDVIERRIRRGGILLRVVDTAGLRETFEEVEQEGVQRSKKWMQTADLVLHLLDPSRPFEKEDEEILKANLGRKTVYVLTKEDLPAIWPKETLPSKLPHNAKIVSISAQTGTGIEALEQTILNQFGLEEFEKMKALMINQSRHQQALIQAQNALKTAETSLQAKLSAELIATDLRIASMYLGEIIGEIHSEDILEEIFSRFCIGK